MTNNKFEIDMCEGAILPKMLKFSLPLMASGILQLLFNAADIIIVGKFAGDDSLGAVGCTSSLINLITNLFIGLSIGSNVMAARHYGAKQEEQLSNTVHTSMVVAVVGGIILTVIGTLLSGELLTLMGTPEEQLGKATLYLKIYFGGIVATLLYNFGSALLRAIGDTTRPMIFLGISGVVNVILNIIFVVAFKMDVAGVAIATVMSQSLSALLVIGCLMKEKGSIRLQLRKLRVDLKELRQIMIVGLPAGIQGCIFSFSNVIIQSSVNGFGNVVVSGNSAAMNLEGFVYVAMNSFHHSTLSFMSQNYGAGKAERMGKILRWGLICVIVAGFTLGMFEVIFGRTLLGIYTNNEAVIDAGMKRIYYIETLYFTCGMMDVMVGAMRGLGYSFMPMIVSLVGVVGVRLVWIALVFRLPQFHVVETIYVSYPISWIATFLVHVITYFAVRKRVMARIAGSR
ncbi:MAG: MATE family efflux transporter [Lachnospiraceae bacterium]|nr:MATE family efflux transporter [Lachnospiraceae bacterium]